MMGLARRVETVEAENAELRRRLGMNSTNSSVPPSKDSIGAKAARRADRSSRERSADRKPGGQPDRKGSGLAPTVTPDRTRTLPPPPECPGCGADLADAVDVGMSWAQVGTSCRSCWKRCTPCCHGGAAAAAGARPPPHPRSERLAL